jgi:hypothetical protein
VDIATLEKQIYTLKHTLTGLKEPSARKGIKAAIADLRLHLRQAIGRL